MQLSLYAFAKADNSTAIPTGGANVTGTLRSPCSIQSPQIEINLGTSVAPQYNHAYIPDFARYYKITNWTWQAPFWVAEMSVDVLASYKGNIGNSIQYVLRSASAKDGTVIDRKYPTRDFFLESVTEIQSNWHSQLTGGTYVVGIINSDSNSMGTVSYYAFTNTQMRNFCNKLLDSTGWLGDFSLYDVTEATLKALLNPFQYVVSAMWFPFSITGTLVSTVPLGWWQIESGAMRIGADTITRYQYNPNIAVHPQAATVGEFMNYSPYSRYNLQFYNWGTIPLDPAKIHQENWNFFIDVDYVSGVGYLRMRTGTSLAGVYASYPAQVAVPISLAQVTQDIAAGAFNILGTVTAASSGGIEAAVGSISGIGNAIESVLPQAHISGSNGSISCYFLEPSITAEFMYLVETDNERFGSPLCKKVQIGTLSGYIQVEKAHLDTASTATVEEIREIENYMEGGFFYE